MGKAALPVLGPTPLNEQDEGAGEWKNGSGSFANAAQQVMRLLRGSRLQGEHG